MSKSRHKEAQMIGALKLVRGAADRVSAHPAGEADAECTRGEFPRTAAGRVFECELVSEPVRRAAEDRSVADRLQRSEAA